MRHPAPRTVIGLLLALLCACAEPLPVMQQLRESGQLRVLTLNQPTSYYLGANGAQGFEYRLASAFAEYLELQLVLTPVQSASAARALLADGSADLAAAQITANEEWKRVGLASTSYQEVAQRVVQRRAAPRARNVSELRGKRLVVRAGSPQSQLLRELKGNGADYLGWTELPREQANPLDWISSGDADFAVVDDAEFNFARHIYPDVIIAFTLTDPREVQWLVRRDGLALRDEVNIFFSAARKSGLLARLEREARAESHDFEYQEAVAFQEDLARRLPPLRAWFDEAALASNLDWRLLVAVGYQESKWQSRAASADGAAGIMMLTASTAESMGVKDRNDPHQSILGGARYLAEVIEMIPARIAEPDRTWFALAAYNVGYGHLEDARVLTQARGGNPDLWQDVSRSLPLLAQESYYLQAKRGYARGWEPVRFVEQVRGFLSILEWYGTPVEEVRLPPIIPMLP